MWANTLRIAPHILGLLQRAREAGVPVIYANDNFGRWSSNFDQVLKHCTQPASLGREIACQLAPAPDDYVVLKPKHSAFFKTPLDLLLKDLGTEQLIITGISTNSCVLFTANDAYMRDLKLCVPNDCVAAQTAEEHASALEQVRNVTKADTSLSTELRLERSASATRA